MSNFESAASALIVILLLVVVLLGTATTILFNKSNEQGKAIADLQHKMEVYKPALDKACIENLIDSKLGN